MRWGLGLGVAVGLVVAVGAWAWVRPPADSGDRVRALGDAPASASAARSTTTESAEALPKGGPAPAGFVPVTDDRPGKPVGNVVGYAKRSAVIPTGAPEDDGGIIDVWDATGRVLLGHLWPNGYGYRTLAEERAEGISREHPPSLPPVPVPASADPGY